MGKVKVVIIRTAGTNCDKETAFAFEMAGAMADLVHINELAHKTKNLDDYQIMAIPGGFTYGDDIASGKILANELRFRIGREVESFIRSGRLIIGICNGFQVLVKAGLLPNLAGDLETIESTLTLNDSDKFEDRWVYLKRTGDRCVWTREIDHIIELPVAHGEGKFIPKNKNILKKIRDNGLVAFEYVDRDGKRAGYPYCPNGSVENIAGICDRTGRIFGLMPHPERYISPYQHPGWTRKSGKMRDGDGITIFRNGVNYAGKYL
ncbi:MAG: phosphoribosylformylglycinamidine synthase I [Candidatus Omnitrophica bacterium]|nr:phosphoribosylformylglycinamidine synthase I [Candidatus Omnitrophota bacterium]